MNNTIYTLISYLPSVEGWHDRCGDYHPGKDSELKKEYFTDLQSIGETMGINKFNEYDTEFTILINGLNEDQYHDFLSDEQQKSLENDCQTIRDVSYAIIEVLKKEKLQKDEEEKLKKAQEAEFVGRREKERLEQLEREQLAILQAKYGK